MIIATGLRFQRDHHNGTIVTRLQCGNNQYTLYLMCHAKQVKRRNHMDRKRSEGLMANSISQWTIRKWFMHLLWKGEVSILCRYVSFLSHKTHLQDFAFHHCYQCLIFFLFPNFNYKYVAKSRLSSCPIKYSDHV